MAGFKRQKREYAGFFHNDLKYVELRGCVCSINVIELASHLLRSANSLKKITSLLVTNSILELVDGVKILVILRNTI